MKSRKNIPTVFLLMLASLLIISACSNSNNTAKETNSKTPVNNSQSANKGTENQANNKIQIVDKVTFTLEDSKVEPVVGDRTADNFSQENGEYFAIGSDLAKAADYEYVTAKFKVENKSDKAIAFSSLGWSAKGNDGYKFKDIDLSDNLDGQIAANNYIEIYYNRQRRHSGCGWIPPAKYKQLLMTKAA